MRVTLKCAAGTFGWLCGNGTFALVNGIPVEVTTTPIKIAIMRINGGRVVRHCVRFYDVVANDSVAAGATTLTVSGCKLVALGGALSDVTRSFTSRAHVTVDKTVKEFAKYYHSLSLSYSVRPKNNDYGYMHRYMTEQDLPKGMPVPVTCGQPLLSDAFREWTDQAVFETFVSCLAAAKLAVSFNSAMVDNVVAVREALYVAALRMFGGVYHEQHETEDDRTLPTTKLYSNFDCDDMALACAAFALRLTRMSVMVFSTTLYTAADLLSHVRPSGALILQGRTFMGGGHNWAVLTMESGRYLHLECTQLFSPHVGRFGRLYGHGVFEQRDRDNMSTVIKGMKQLETDMYSMVCAAYSEDAMYIPTTNSSMCVDYATFMSGDALMQEVPVCSMADPAIRALRATPSPAEISKVVERADGAYNVVYGNCHPQACTKYKGDGFRLVTSSTTRCFTVSPANAMEMS